MLNRRLFGGLVVVSMLIWPTLSSAADKLSVDYIFAEDYSEKGTIKFYVDLIDDEHNVIDGLEAQSIQVFANGERVLGTLQVESFEDAKEYLSVAVMLGGHQSYAPPETYHEDGELVPPPPPDVFELQKTGFANFVGKLSGSDRIAIFMYNESGLQVIDNWSEDHDTAADRITKNAKRPSEKTDILAPDLFRQIRSVVDNKIGDEDDLERRRILVVMSDGKDAKPGRREKMIEDIAERAANHDVKVYVIGFTQDDPNLLVPLSTLATKTGGVYREIPDTDAADIPMVIENLANELKKQYVITFKPDEFSGDAEKRFTFRLEVETPGGRNLEDEFDEDVKVLPRPTNWGSILKWVGIGVGSLLGLFLLWKLIGMIIRARRREPEVAYEEEYSGPYKGKLTCIGGAYIGTEFFLTEEVTTIGALPGNTFVIQDAGVSKRHCGIKIEEMRFELADFGSTNGTLVNGNKITKQFLRDGDVFALGDVRLKFTLK